MKQYKIALEPWLLTLEPCDQPGELEAHIGALKLQSGAMETHRGASEAYLGAKEDQPGAMQGHPLLSRNYEVSWRLSLKLQTLRGSP
jgi:hypothetical protein